MQFLEDKNYLHETWCDTCAEHEMTAQRLCPHSAKYIDSFCKTKWLSQNNFIASVDGDLCPILCIAKYLIIMREPDCV